MPAPRTKPDNGSVLALAALLLGPWACASHRPESPPSATRAAGDAASDDFTAPPVSSPAEALEPLEASLAAYEQQLAHNESRLRAMGVRIAAADTTSPKASEAAASDSRFAAPPPKLSGEAPLGGAERATDSKKRSPAKAKTAASTSTPAPAPAPTTTTRPSPRPATGRASEDKADPDRERLPADAAPDADTTDSRCAELCDLAHATCELEAKICDLAARHAEDPHYAEVCRRADDDCRLASESCNLCSP